VGDVDPDFTVNRMDADIDGVMIMNVLGQQAQVSGGSFHVIVMLLIASCGEAAFP